MGKNEWLKVYFDERQLKEMDFCEYYANHFAHGAVGHNEKMIIARLYGLVKIMYVILEEEGLVSKINQTKEG